MYKLHSSTTRIDHRFSRRLAFDPQTFREKVHVEGEKVVFENFPQKVRSGGQCIVHI